MPGRTLHLIWPHDPASGAPAKYRRACGYDAHIPDPITPLDPVLPATIAGLVAEADAAIRSLNARAHPALAPLGRLLRRSESLASSKIEGLQLGARALARAEAELEQGRSPGPTARDILANIDAMELAIGDGAAARRFGVADIRAIHARLMAHALNAPRLAGVIRTTQNWIGGNDYAPCGADFVPPPPDELTRLLDDLCAAINDDVLPPLVQAALVHAQFETIHPFADGNGRTGRALIHVVLRRRGVATAFVPPVSVVLARARTRYVDGLTAFRRDADGVVTWIEQFAAAAHAAARLAERYVGRVEDLREQWRARLSTATDRPRADAAAWRILDALPAHPIITAPVASAVTGRVKSQVYEALAVLERHGILRPLGTAKRHRAWEADGLLPLIEAMESEAP